MAASIAITPASGSITSLKSVCRIDVSGASTNDTTSYNNTLYPTSPGFHYYLTFELGGSTRGKSYLFNVDGAGKHSFPNYIFPESGSWTVRLNDAADDSSVATAAVTVS